MEKTTRRRVSILISALLLTLTCVLSLFAGAASAAESFNITRLTTDGDNHHPQVSGDRVVWESFDGNDREIFTWTPVEGLVQLTVNDYDDSTPRVSDDRVVWCGSDGDYPDIFTWMPTRNVIRVTDRDRYVSNPQVSGDRVVWEGIEGGLFQIFTWTPGEEVIQVSESGCSNSHATVSGDRIVWQGADGNDYEIFTWTPTDGVVQVTDNGYQDTWPQVSGDRIVWKGYEGGKWRAFTWTPTGGIIRLMAEGEVEHEVQVSGDRVVWESFDGNDREIFTWTPSGGVVQLTANDQYDGNPQVSGDRVVWESFDGNDREIFTWTPSGGVVQLTANDQYDGNPQVSGHRIVWAGNGAESPDVFVATRDFSDVPVGHPYREAVMGMADRGIISGYTSGTFGLDDPVKRAQFAKMIVGTLGITPGTSTATRFTDLGAPDAKGYPHVFVQAAYENDITKGTNIGQTLFGPWDSIRRDQVVSMIVRGAKSLFPGMFKEPPVETGSYFAGVSEPHGANLRTAQYNGLLDGLLGMGTGWQNANATRGEVAKMLFNMLSLAPASPLSPESIANARRLGGTSHIGETLYFVIGAKLTTELEAQHVLERMGNEIHGLQFYFTVQKSDNFEGMEPGWWVVFEARRTSATGYDMDWYQRGFPDAIVVQATVRTSDPIPVYEDIVGGFD